ncbi:MAG: acyl-CoA mutase large subunit family protein [Acidimicrobiales bacterium]
MPPEPPDRAPAVTGDPAAENKPPQPPTVTRRSAGPSTEPRRTGSGIEVKACYWPEDLEGGGATPWDPRTALGEPGEYPFTRGIHPEMYRARHWTMRQYAGFGSAAETNQRFKYLLEAGQTGLSVAFDLPTQMGYDSDHPLASGEVGRVGVAIDTLDDMRTLMGGLPLDRVTTSMTINATAPILLLLYQLAAEEAGFPAEALSGTVQNDILKEYIARGTYIYPPRPSMRLVTDTFAYCAEHLPSWNTISVSGYHIREAGASAVQELAFTLANAIAYVEAALEAGLGVDQVGGRLSFFWNAHNDIFEEVAKYRAARRMWARIMRERFGATEDRSAQMRFHAQTAGSTLTAAQPELNMVRVTLQALAAVLGGTQSLHTNSFDEALGLPTEHAARLALRTQQVIAHESGVTATVDPLGGSWYVESLTDAVEAAAGDYLERIASEGGAIAAIESKFFEKEIEASAYAQAQSLDRGAAVVVGVNRFAEAEPEEAEEFRIDPALEAACCERLRAARDRRDPDTVAACLEEVRAVAGGAGNLLVPMREALRVGASLGEVSDVLRGVFGTYRPRV